jgi:hypothetical protein
LSRSKIIETIQNQCVDDDALVYHYCRFSDRATLSAERLIGAMITQLLSKVTDGNPLSESLNKLFNRYRSSSYPTLMELGQSFRELCQRHSRTFVIIDGLDEIIDRSGILEFLTELGLADVPFKIFVASRLEVDLEHAFESYLTVAITQPDVQLDMETYVQQRLKDMQIGNGEETDLHDFASKLVERAQGM